MNLDIERTNRPGSHRQPFGSSISLKRVLHCLLMAIIVLLLVACGQDEMTQQDLPKEKIHRLSYVAGQHGSIDGPAEQQLTAGTDGLTVTAVPAVGYHFVSWSDGLTSARRIDRNVQADLNLVADFARNQYQLTYDTEGNGRIEGLVEQQVTHGEDGQTVKAVPAPDHHFVAWSDGIETAERTERTVSADLQLVARFAVDNYMLNYTVVEHGSIAGESEQLVDHGQDGSEVEAVPATGYRFDRWSDGLKTAKRIDRNLTSAQELSAIFVPAEYRLEYLAGADGTISGETVQVVSHGGSATLVKAVPAENHHFQGWSDGITTAERLDRNVTSDLRVTANFSINKHQLTYSAGQGGSISGPARQSVPHGHNGQEVTAVPAAGYHFVAWSDGIKTTRRVDSNLVAPLELKAEFALNRYLLSYRAAEHGSIEGLAEQQVEHGQDAEPVEAVAEPGYLFVRWSDGVTTARRADTRVTGALQVEAEFVIKTYAVSGQISGLVEGTELKLQNNGEDYLTISENGEFRFPVELVNLSRYLVEVAVQPTSPNQTCSVSAGSGVIAAADVTDVEVVCRLNKYSIGGTLSGLPAGDRVILSNNDIDKLVLKVDGQFSFEQPLEDGSEYLAKIVGQPERENWICELANGSGQLTGQDVTDLVVDCYPQVVLQPLAGLRKIDLDWNAADFTAWKVTFNLCMAEEKITEDGFDRCAKLPGGAQLAEVRNPLEIADLINDQTYWFQLEASYANGRKTLSEAVSAVPFGGLNDSGIDWCANGSRNYRVNGTRSDKERSCQQLVAEYPGQDGIQGRDALARVRKQPKTGSGTAGFDFTKSCRSGEAAGEKKCPANPSPGQGYDEWACTLDNVTGLTWEIKTETGLRGQDKLYSWYQSNKKVNGGDEGRKVDGDCEKEDCDTAAYIQAVNKMELCGYSDWRLPTRRELLSIVDNGQLNPAVDRRFFPNTRSDYYWTSTPYQDQQGFAWQVYFFYGESKPEEKTKRKPVRLVRGQTITFGMDNPR